jgi:hypothetical protein
MSQAMSDRPGSPYKRMVLIVVGVVALASGLTFDAAPAGAVTPGYVESAVSNPVTALPPVSRPPTRHCTVTAMRHVFANSYGVPYTGTLTPPAGCRGPWSKVVLDWTGSVAGRQYDRLFSVYVANTEVLRSSTPEPVPDGITWHVEKDISEFIPLLREAEPLTVDLGNIVNATYTGAFDITMTVSYYGTGPNYPAVDTADDVVTLAQPTADNNGAYTLNAGGSATATVTLPRDITAARLEVYARGGGCDEQWFTAVPDDLAARYPDWLCGGGPYREVQVSVDGIPAGAAQVYPVVYTGGIVPTLWRPIPAIDSFVTLPYNLDLTPFAALLSNGSAHSVTLTPFGDNDYWLVDATLFLDENPGHVPTTGGLTRDTLSLTPKVVTTEADSADGATTTATVTVDRDWTIEGYLDTPHGRQATSVHSTSRYRNVDAVSQAGTHQVVRQEDTGSTAVTTSGRPAMRDAWSYPIDVDASILSYVDGNNYDLAATVSQQRHLRTEESTRGGWQPLSWTDDTLTATGELARSAGVVTASDGATSERYVGTDDTGHCYDHLVAADHGLVTVDSVNRCR